MGKGSDTIKAAALILLIVGFLGIAVYRLMGGNTAPKTEPVTVVPLDMKSGDDLKMVAALPHTTTGLQAAPGTAVPGGTGQQAFNGTQKTDAYSGPIPPAPHDPFKPPAGVADSKNTASGSTMRGSAGFAQETVNHGKLPSVSGGGAQGDMGPMMVQQPPQAPIELKGLIMGEPAIAVLSIGGEISYRQQGE